MESSEFKSSTINRQHKNKPKVLEIEEKYFAEEKYWKASKLMSVEEAADIKPDTDQRDFYVSFWLGSPIRVGKIYQTKFFGTILILRISGNSVFKILNHQRKYKVGKVYSIPLKILRGCVFYAPLELAADKVILPSKLIELELRLFLKVAPYVIPLAKKVKGLWQIAGIIHIWVPHLKNITIECYKLKKKAPTLFNKMLNGIFSSFKNNLPPIDTKEGLLKMMGDVLIKLLKATIELDELENPSKWRKNSKIAWTIIRTITFNRAKNINKKASQDLIDLTEKSVNLSQELITKFAKHNIKISHAESKLILKEIQKNQKSIIQSFRKIEQELATLKRKWKN